MGYILLNICIKILSVLYMGLSASFPSLSCVCVCTCLPICTVRVIQNSVHAVYVAFCELHPLSSQFFL